MKYLFKLLLNKIFMINLEILQEIIDSQTDSTHIRHDGVQ